MSEGTRLSPSRLSEITGKQRPSAQVRWFKRLYGITLPCDHAGPVISATAFEGIIAKKCGLHAEEKALPRPQVQLIKR